MLLGIQLALLVVGVIVALRGRMGGARGHEVVGVRARAAGVLIGVMAGASIAMTHAPGRGIETLAMGPERLAALAVQGVWLVGAMVLATLVAGSGRPEPAIRGRRVAA